MILKFLLVGYYLLLTWYFQPLNLMYYDIENYKFPEINDFKSNHQKRIYAIDFDNSIAYTQFPKIISPIPYAVEVLRVLTKDPNSILILWTCREEETLQQALDFCELFDIHFDYVNENDKEKIELYKNDCRKISADVYIDDKSYQGICGVEKLWKDWYLWMKENHMIEE